MGRRNTYRYPLAPHLLSHWTPGERRGSLTFPLGESGRLLALEYRQYSPPEYFLGQHFLGTFALDGLPLRVVERYRYHTVNNSGTLRWSGEATSDRGLCACSEIVMAHDAGHALALRPDKADVWLLEASLDVDQTFHEIEFDGYRCRGRLGLQSRELVLQRSYHRDAST